MDPVKQWSFLPYGFAITVVIETSVLLLGLSWRHPVVLRLFAGFWLTACTYPCVILVFPMIADLTGSRPLYFLVAESFAIVGECLLFHIAVNRRNGFSIRDTIAITFANLCSCFVGLIMFVFW